MSHEVLGDTRTLPYAELEVFEHLADILPQFVDQKTANDILQTCRTAFVSSGAQVNLRDLHTVMRHCRRCPDMVEDPWLPKWNLINPLVVFIAEVHSATPDAMNGFIDALRQSGWSSKECALTYLTRCLPTSSRPVADHEIQNCARYLWGELEAWRPRLIVPMGVKPTEFIYGSSVKISDVRGKLNWLGPWAILPTYGPAHVLRSNLQQDLIQDLNAARKFCGS